MNDQNILERYEWLLQPLKARFPDLVTNVYDYGHSLHIVRIKRKPIPLGLDVEIAVRPDIAQKGYSINLQVARKMKVRGQVFEYFVEKLKDA